MPPTINIQEVAHSSGTAAAVAVWLQNFKVGEEIELTFWEDDTVDSFFPSTATKSVQMIGTVKGKVVPFASASSLTPVLSLDPTGSEKKAKSKYKFIVAFPQDGGPARQVEFNLPDEAADKFEGDFWEVFATTESDGVSISSTTSLLARIRRALSVQNGEATYSFHQNHQVQFYHDAAVDLSGSGGYMSDLLDALKRARDFIFIADWSFHPLTRLRHSDHNNVLHTIGGLLVAHAQLHPDILIAIHVWDSTGEMVLGVPVASPDDQNKNGDKVLDQIARAGFGMSKRPPNLLWRMSSRTGVGYSHHQKFVVFDEPVVFGDEVLSSRRRISAFFGGIDLTKGRFDTPVHPILPDDSPASDSFYDALSFIDGKDTIKNDDWYSAEFYTNIDNVPKSPRPRLPRQPWHDIAVRVLGPSCWDLVREFTGRWLLDPSSWGFGGGGDKDEASRNKLLDKFKSLFTATIDPKKPYHYHANPLVYSQQWDPALGPWSVQICRSMAREHWEQKKPLVLTTADHTHKEFRWTVNGNFERSIQLTYIQAITQAESFIYIETQYFISSGNMWHDPRPSVANVVAINLAQRAIAMAKDGKNFHIYLIIPMFPEGDPGDGANAAQRQFQWRTIRAMAQLIATNIGPGKNWEDYLSVFFLARWHDLGGKLPNTLGSRENNVINNKRYQIYVHAKYMLIDDRYMFIGSANLNERSLNGGRDSEIGAAFWPTDDRFLDDCKKQATNFRNSIWEEHLGPALSKVATLSPEDPACVAAIRAAADENYKAFREGRFDPNVHGHLCRWPIQLDMAKPAIIQGTSKAPEEDFMIPDRAWGLSADQVRAWQVDAPGPQKKALQDLTSPKPTLAVFGEIPE